MKAQISTVLIALNKLESAIDELRKAIEQLDQNPVGCDSTSLHRQVPQHTSPLHSSPSSRQNVNLQLTLHTSLGRPAQAVLSAIALLSKSNPMTMHTTLVAALAGYSPSERTFVEALDSLIENTFVQCTAKCAVLTELGRQVVPSPKELLTSDLLAERIAAQLTERQKVIFNFLFAKRGSNARRSELAVECGAGRSDRALQKDLDTLQKLSLIERTANNTFACTDMLFLD